MQNEELIKAGRQSADAIKTASLRATIMYQLCDALEAADKALADCRNELCQRCGQYKRAHLGYCDGCRWKKGME